MAQIKEEVRERSRKRNQEEKPQRIQGGEEKRRGNRSGRGGRWKMEDRRGERGERDPRRPWRTEGRQRDGETQVFQAPISLPTIIGYARAFLGLIYAPVSLSGSIFTWPSLFFPPSLSLLSLKPPWLET